MEEFELRMDFFQPRFDIVLAFAGNGIFAGIIEHFVIGEFVFAGNFSLGLQIKTGCFKVKIVEHIAPGLDLPRETPIVDVLLLRACGPIGRDERNLLIAFNGGVRSVRIGDGQGMPPVLMLEIVVNALLLHQPADKVKIGLAVLHAIFPHAIGSAEFKFHIGRRVLIKYFFDDVGNGHFLKNAAVRSTRQKP